MNHTVIISERPKCKTCNELAKEWNPFQEEYECVKCIANRISDSLIEIVKKQLNNKKTNNMKYRKKPVVIHAVQYDGNFRCLDVFSIYEVKNFIIGTDDAGNPCLKIPTLEGVMIASKGDYIIRGVKGEYYPCKPDIFEMTYELASASSQTEISDEEIEKIAKEYVLYNESKRNWVVEGMKLYREQLKKKQ